MSQMPPFLRGYRQALRDLQHAVVLHGRTKSRNISTSSAVMVAADQISEPLRELRVSGAGSLDTKLREQLPASSTKEMEFAQGYQAGFDEAVDIVADWGRKMNNPAARNAIAKAVSGLRKLRSQIIFEENRKMSTRRARKFVIKA